MPVTHLPVISVPNNTLRVSSLDSLFRCAPSVLDTTSPRIGFTHPLSVEGRLVHTILMDSLHPDNNGLVHPSDDYMNKNGVDPSRRDDVMMLARYGWEKWETIFSKHMTDPQLEHWVQAKLNNCDVTLNGTIDVFSRSDDNQQVFFIDWKSGFLQYGHYNQMAGYAYCIRKQFNLSPDVVVKGIVVYLRNRRYRVYDFDASTVEQWAHNLVRNVLPTPNADTRKTGEHCRYCDIYASCQARHRETQATLDAMLFGDKNMGAAEYQRIYGKAKELIKNIDTVNKYTPEVAQAVEDMYFRYRMAEKAVEDTKKLLKGALDAAGTIPLPNNTALAIQSNDITKINTEKAWQKIRQKFSDAEIKTFTTVRKGDMINALKKQCERGQARTAIEQWMNTLEQLEALDVSTQQRMVIKDITVKEIMSSERKKNVNTGNNDGSCGGGD